MDLLLHKVFRIIKVHGIGQLIKRIKRKIENKLIKKINGPLHKKQLEEILSLHKGKPIIVFPPLVDWNIPLFQRPQHIACNLANEGFLYFYCTGNLQYDSVEGFQQINKSCYLTNRYDLVSGLPVKKILHLYSTNMAPMERDFIGPLDKDGDTILYEYIDEIHEDISGKIPKFVMERHEHILKNEQCIVVATADKLYDEVLQNRKYNCMLVTNGVDYNHFCVDPTKKAVPLEIVDLVEKKKPIIGYFGALASWFDYELIEKLAFERPDYEVLLIGWNYDNSIKSYSLDRFDNVRVIGPIDYKYLPSYSQWFDVSIIPFRINDITDSTSPVKLFEYMAMGYPVVTTNMPECRKYKSVLIGKDYGEFILKVDEALSLKNDPDYAKLIKGEAMLNTWDTKARDIAGLIKENLNLNT